MSEPSHAQHARIIAGTVIAGFCVFLQLYAPQPLLALFRHDFTADEAHVSLVISAAALGVAISSPFLGMFADAAGRKRIIVPSLFALALTTLACAAAPTLQQLIFWRLLGGICTPGVIAVTFAYISEESASHSAGSINALYVTGTVIGGLVGRLTAAFAADHLNWHWSFVFLGSMTLLGAMAVWIVLPRSRRFSRQKQFSKTLHAMGHHLLNTRLLATYGCGFVILFSHIGLFTYVNFHLAKPPFSLSTTALGLIFLVYGLGIFITPLSGRLVDRMGHRAGIALGVSLLVTGAALTLIPNLAVVIIGTAIASSGVFVSQATTSSHVVKVAKSARSAASGLYVSFYYLGGSAGGWTLAFPWKFAAWPGVVATIIILQVAALALTWRFFNHMPARKTVHASPAEVG
ncbi:MAG TPA: MFS transporter [Phycisphaerae bacterium]|nr:MFS transporter [Phycisphaerae bacterium]